MSYYSHESKLELTARARDVSQILPQIFLLCRKHDLLGGLVQNTKLTLKSCPYMSCQLERRSLAVRSGERTGVAEAVEYARAGAGLV